MTPIEEYEKIQKECTNILSGLFQEHKNNSYALNKMYAYITNLNSLINNAVY